MPRNQAAWILAAGQPLKVGDAQYEPPGPQDIMIRNQAVAINPVDWKMQDHGMFIESYPTVFGCDVAGTVEEVGSEVKSFAPGDRVIGNAPCLTLGQKYAAFQAYVPCPANVACKIPENVSFEEGCVLPLAVNTAAQGLFAKGHLELPMPSLNPKPSDTAIFIYGGSTSVGATAIQLAKAAGVFVVSVAGKANHEFCKSLGADIVLDYKEAGWEEKVAAAMQGLRIAGAYDSIGSESTSKACAAILASTGSDFSVMSVLPLPEGIKGKGVFGSNVTLDDDLAKAIWLDFLGQALAKGLFVPKPDPLIAGNGLESIQQGMDMQLKGVSARKVVISIV